MKPLPTASDHPRLPPMSINEGMLGSFLFGSRKSVAVYSGSRVGARGCRQLILSRPLDGSL